ncbi:MAG: competence/damage-inducible protein A [Defluviitaleaceae bacterium]|nr:competence/damage-inducible protein A [Defluviitaleaceae bacterium]
MTAEILAVGTEILLGDIVNTNAQFISQRLAEIGVNVYMHTAVGDNPRRLFDAYAQAFCRADLVIATGGLGPTDDDITKEVAAEYFGLPLELHEPSWEAIKNIFSNNAFVMTSNNKKQAMLPAGCRVFPNGNGTAPGVCVERGGKTLIMLPGPPNELEPMFVGQVVPLLREKTSAVFVSRTLKVCGVGESRAAAILKDVLDAQTNPTVAPYAKTNEAWLRITASAADETEARGLIEPVAQIIYGRLGDNIYGEDADSLESVVIKMLACRGLTVACAESCTGGLLASRLVDCPGASAVFTEGVVTYSNESKIKRLGVSQKTIENFGAVSGETAAEMAEGIARSSGADVGISVTGVAGPSGGTDQKPVGLVYIGLFILNKGVQIKESRFGGTRSKIRERSVSVALDMLRRELM